MSDQPMTKEELLSLNEEVMKVIEEMKHLLENMKEVECEEPPFSLPHPNLATLTKKPKE